jgi:hypothetical protein
MIKITIKVDLAKLEANLSCPNCLIINPKLIKGMDNFKTFYKFNQEKMISLIIEIRKNKILTKLSLIIIGVFLMKINQYIILINISIDLIQQM